jgi:hypothetical protein
MRLRILSKIAGLSLLYVTAFLLIVCVQFSRQTSFSRKVGNFVISGQIREQAETGERIVNDEYLINEYAKVAFGGLDFILSNDANNPVILVDEDGNEAPLVVDSLKISGDTAHFLLSDGVELVFYTQDLSDTNGLIISGILPEKASALHLPYLPLSFAKTTIDEEGRWAVTAHKVNFIFDRQLLDNAGQKLILGRDDPVVFYHAVPESKSFNPALFIVRGGMEQILYEEQLNQWLDKMYTIWEKNISATTDETLVAAFLAEAVRRGSYPGAIAAIADSFKTSAAQTYLSSPFLGRLDVALRTLSAEEKAETDRLAALARENPRMLLAGSQAFKYRLLPENEKVMDFLAVYARNTSTADIALSETAGIMESCLDWPVYAPGQENPFERLVPYALEVVSEQLVKDSGASTVFVSENSQVDIAFNVRLGLALSAYGNKSNSSGWAGIGRSLVLSVLSLCDDRGQLPEILTLDAAGQIVPDGKEGTIEAMRLYRAFPPAVYYPHTVNLASAQSGVRVWTVSGLTTATLQNNVLDLSLSFPVGWTHHVLIRGVKQFSKIQIRDMDYRSDPRFEQYNSPGWVYSASTETLLLKMVHRLEEEHIRIYY